MKSTTPKEDVMSTQEPTNAATFLEKVATATERIRQDDVMSTTRRRRGQGSMYTDRYLETTGRGVLFTPATFLQYVLRGRAKSFSGRYLDALVRDLESRPDVRRVRSARGGVAYVRAEQIGESC